MGLDSNNSDIAKHDIQRFTRCPCVMLITIAAQLPDVLESGPTLVNLRCNIRRKGGSEAWPSQPSHPL